MSQKFSFLISLCIYSSVICWNSEIVEKGACGKENRTESVGHFQPKNATIKVGAECTWVIKPESPKAKEIFVIIEEFFLNDDDSFTVTDDTSGKQIFPPFHGKLGPFSLLTGSLDLTAVVNASKTKFPPRKFSAVYSANDCSYTVMPPASGLLVSPLYASGRSDTVTCVWKIKPFETTQKVSIAFQSFSLGDSKLTISGSDGQDGDYSGSAPPDIISSQPLTLTLQLNTAKPNQIFRVIYEPVTFLCSQFIKLDKTKGVNLASPTPEDVFEGKYDRLQCHWVIASPNGTTMQLKLNSLQLNGSLDRIAINDGGSILSPTIGEINVLNQKESKGQTYKTSKNYMWVSFTTPFLLSATSFAAEITILSSWNEPTDSGFNNESVVPESTTVMWSSPQPTGDITFTTKSTEMSSLSSHQALTSDIEMSTATEETSTVYPDDSYKASPEPHHCVDKPLNFSEESFKPLKHRCGDSKRNDSSGHLWPKHCFMSRGLKCAYNITSPSNHEIFLMIDQFFMRDDDSLDIYPLLDPFKKLFGPFKGVKEPFSILTGVPEIQVVVQASNDRPGNRVFSARYNTTECYDDNALHPYVIGSGKVTSPLYSTSSGDPVTCTWKLNTFDPDYVISLAITKISLSGNSSLTIQSNLFNFTYKDGSPPDIIGAEMVILNLDRSVPNQVVQFEYEFVAKICSENIDLSENHTQTIQLSKSKELSAVDVTSFNCHWVVTSLPNTVIGIDFTKLHLNGPLDGIVVNDGGSMFSSNLWSASLTNQNIKEAQYLRTTRNEAWCSFRSPFLLFKTNFSVTFTMYDQGGYKKGSGDIEVHPSDHSTNSVFLLEAVDLQQIMVNVDEKNFCKSPCTVSFYEGFSDSKLIRILEGFPSSHPIYSPSSKMMIIVNNISESSNFKATFKSIPPGCNQVSTSSSDTYTLSGNCDATCSWTITPQIGNDNAILALHTAFFSLDPAISVEIFKLDSQQHKVASFVSSSDSIPPLYLDASSGAYIQVTRGSCQKEINSTAFFANAVVMPECSSSFSIEAPSTATVMSPDFPNLYPWLAECWWNVTTRDALYLSFQQLHFAPGHCLKIYHKNTLVETFNSNNSLFPSDVLLSSDVEMNFLSTSCDGSKNVAVTSRKGFVINVTAINCGSSIRTYNGSFTSPNYPNPETKTIQCRWIVSVPKPEESNEINIIRYNISWGKSGHQDRNLKIYDGSSVQNYEVMNITEGIPLLSRTDTVVFAYNYSESQQIPSYGFTVTYEAQACKEPMMCSNGICMHHDWLCNGVNDCGDFSDEKNCFHHGSLGEQKVPVWAMSFSIPFTFLLGAFLGAICFPYLRKRYQESRQVRYSSVSVINEIDEE